jgi:hypothetical protein
MDEVVLDAMRVFVETVGEAAVNALLGRGSNSEYDSRAATIAACGLAEYAAVAAWQAFPGTEGGRHDPCVFPFVAGRLSEAKGRYPDNDWLPTGETRGRKPVRWDQEAKAAAAGAAQYLAAIRGKGTLTRSQADIAAVFGTDGKTLAKWAAAASKSPSLDILATMARAEAGQLPHVFDGVATEASLARVAPRKTKDEWVASVKRYADRVTWRKVSRKLVSP